MRGSDDVRPLRYGQIVLAHVGDGHGNFKTRPVVIVTRTEEFEEDGLFEAVCISTHIEDPLPPEHVKLPWHRSGHPRTGLDRPNVAKCNWVVEIDRSEVVKVLGDAPASRMIDISEALMRRDRQNESDDSGEASGEPPRDPR
jgi:mRNA-degrading endonuclease toxin of MazEF toxin-antitoxin module